MTSERIYRIIASIGICACCGCLFTRNAQNKKQNDNHNRKDEHHE